jgi:hypothetical protein
MKGRGLSLAVDETLISPSTVPSFGDDQFLTVVVKFTDFLVGSLSIDHGTRRNVNDTIISVFSSLVARSPIFTVLGFN